MITKSKIQEIRKLHKREGREAAQLFIVEGTKSCLELLQSSIPTVHIFATEKWLSKHHDILFPNIETVSAAEMERLSCLKTTPEVLAIAQIPQFSIEEIKPEKPLLVLDNITNPGNLGTIIRTADWFGISQILCSEQTVEFTNPKVIQSTMGSFTRSSIIYTNLPAYLSTIKNRPILGLLMEGKAIEEVAFPSNSILVVGNESRGISEEVMALLTTPVHIPSYNPNFSSAESLNASIAAAIALFQMSKTIAHK